MSKSVDWDLCLKLSNNKPKLAQELLELLAKDLPQYQTILAKAKQQQNFTELEDHIHKLHGACCYVGVPKLKLISQELESLLKANQTKQLLPLIDALSAEIQSVLTSLKQHSFK